MASATITAENQWTPNVNLRGHGAVSVSGTFVATVRLQRSFDGGATWGTVGTAVGPAEGSIYDPAADAVYRCGVATGEFTSGSITIRLNK